MKPNGCLNCDHANKPKCYSDCPDYLALKEDFAKRKAYLKQSNANQKAYEFTHTDLAKKRRKRK